MRDISSLIPVSSTKVKLYFIFIKAFLKGLLWGFLFYSFFKFLFFFPMEDWIFYNFLVVPLGIGVTKGISAIIGILIGLYLGRRALLNDLSRLELSRSGDRNQIVKKWSISKIERLYSFFSFTAYLGVIPLFIILVNISSHYCVNVGGGSIGSERYTNIGCSLGTSLITLIFIGFMFAGLPIWIIIFLSTITAFVKNIWLKFLFSLPIFLTFLLFLGLILLIIDNSGIVLLIIIIISTVLLGKSLLGEKEDRESLLVTPHFEQKDNSLLMKILCDIKVSNIDCVYFHENGGKSYKINLHSIKQIAFFIKEKSGKSIFSPGELRDERELLLKYYQSNLPEKDYNILIGYLSEWVEKGGSFEIINYENNRS